MKKYLIAFLMLFLIPFIVYAEESEEIDSPELLCIYEGSEYDVVPGAIMYIQDTKGNYEIKLNTTSDYLHEELDAKSWVKTYDAISVKYDTELYDSDGYYLNSCPNYINHDTSNQITFYDTRKFNSKKLMYDNNGSKISGSKYDNEKGNYESNISYVEHVDYGNICGNGGVRNVMRIIGRIISIFKYVIPILIIVFGMLDFSKAVISNDEKAVDKAIESLIRRVISGIVVFFVPTIIWAILNTIDLAVDIDDEFKACTKCMLKLECDKK